MSEAGFPGGALAGGPKTLGRQIWEPCLKAQFTPWADSVHTRFRDKTAFLNASPAPAASFCTDVTPVVASAPVANHD